MVRIVKIVKDGQIGQVMFPHHSDQISQNVTGLLGWKLKKVGEKMKKVGKKLESKSGGSWRLSGVYNGGR